MSEELLDEIIKGYPSYSPIKDPFIMLFLGLIITITCGVWFARIMQIKIINYEKEGVSPIPLKRPDTAVSWSGSFTGLTLFFCGMLQIFDFNSIKSLIASILISGISGTTMWRVIKDLMHQLDSGKIKEIDEYF